VTHFQTAGSGMHDTRLPVSAKENIESVAGIEKELTKQRSLVDRISERITAFVGSMTFVLVHVLWFIGWVVVNRVVEAAGYGAFDPYPYIFLNLALSIEAVLLATFVLITQNRQSRQAEQWGQLDLQVNLLAERETTKMLQMLNAICARLGVAEKDDKELKEMIKNTHVEALAEHLEKTRDSAAKKGGSEVGQRK
jgi:uncharacterized membrane protein